jgi:hypothetical protein
MHKIEINLQELQTLIESFDKLLVPNGKPMVLFKSNSIRVRDNHDELMVNEYNKEYERRLNSYTYHHFGESMFYCRHDLEMMKYNVARELNEYLHYKFTPRINSSGNFIVEDRYEEHNTPNASNSIYYYTNENISCASDSASAFFSSLYE